MKRILLAGLLLTSCLTMTGSGHFITDAQYRVKMDSLFENRMDRIGRQFFDISKEKADTDETEALKFLYSYMPLADVTDYPLSFFLDNIRCSFQARSEMEWGRTVPELIFRHFVLPLRVNNEALDSSRRAFYNELKERVKGMTMHDAILEVNHWCHEKVTYQPSDARTSSPLATVRTATGRCGEQSTFTVAALRAVGIPARQVYTPRWAHTDDNHAWVEAWADGKWYFFGACEPEPVLNLGWFNAPASRAMLMHTRVFGDYAGPEEVIGRSSNYTEINLTSNYASTASVTIRVTDGKNRPIKGARVDFKIYNYAEFYTAVTKYTDTKGEANLSAGLGDMLVWASDKGNYTFRKVTFDKDKNVTLRIGGNSPETADGYKEQTVEIVPPKENPKMPFVSDEMAAQNRKRLEREDSIRNAYVSTFLTREEAAKISPEGADFLVKSRGNHKTIASFIERHKDNEARALELLGTLSDKDLRDMQSEILEDNYTSHSSQLCPRVEDEMIILPFKNYFAREFKQESSSFKANPERLVDWIKKNIRMNNEKKALQIAQTPVGVMRSHLTDNRSRDIFFVDVARSLDIKAQKDPVTGAVQYWKDGHWRNVDFGKAEQVQPLKGKLVLDYSPTKFLDNPKYYTHFSISKINNGVTRLLSFSEGQTDMGDGTTWSNTFKSGYDLEEGEYLLTTGTRLASGSVRASNTIFRVKAGQTTKISLTIVHNANDVSVIGSFNSESLITRDNKDVSILSQTGRGYYVLGVIGVGQEPTNHALHDIEKLKSEFEKWGRPVVVLFENEEAAAKFKKDEFKNLPSTLIFAIDKDGSVRKQIAKEMKLANNGRLPVFILSDTFNRVVFVSQGYTIGLGEQIINVVKTVSEKQ